MVEGGTKKTSGIKNDSSTSRATTAALVISYDSFQMIPPNKVVETNLQLLRQPTEHRVHLGDCLEFGSVFFFKRFRRSQQGSQFMYFDS